MPTAQAGPSSYARIVPVLTVPSVAMADPLAEALAEGGLRCVEVTLRTGEAENVLKTMAAHRELTVGAGTVLTAEQARRAVGAGAAFLVSPGFDEDLVAACWELGVPLIPGAATATELMCAQRAGIGLVKLFPAERLGGLATLEALAAPFPRMRFMPTGGIGADQAAAYLAHPSVSAVGGSWIAPADCLRRGDYSEIRRLAAQAAKLGAAGRGGES
ncbi:MAG: bifunctional 4-hydroxy-2-oxoglutarate aldolase/2-dehydro-3-deoxy-phosphogluconate aldolase [Catenulispora sp.]|nr:bifunctional 4-hydroxy-2-oxoglutarate aldolase/2-dehydro-3-deoxy-phosphogluconate aldolase [Catenulispora sp.]